ncbi:MAG: hypothetical protein ACREV9_02170 [Burkholderiales bacterium]
MRRFCVCFTFLLLFAQHAALAHAISHVSGGVASEQSLPHSQVCDECLAYANLGAAANTCANSAPISPFVHAAATDFGDVYTPFFLRAFASRAPPLSF